VLEVSEVTKDMHPNPLLNSNMVHPREVMEDNPPVQELVIPMVVHSHTPTLSTTPVPDPLPPPLPPMELPRVNIRVKHFCKGVTKDCR